MKNLSLYIVIAAAALTVACGGSAIQSGSSAGTASAGAEPNGQVRAQTPEQNRIVISEAAIEERGSDTIRLGRVRQGEYLTTNLELVNQDTRPLVIVSVERNCGCLDLEYAKQPLRPSESRIAELHFDSRGQSGTTFKTLNIRTSLSSKPYTLAVLAEVE